MKKIVLILSNKETLVKVYFPPSNFVSGVFLAKVLFFHFRYIEIELTTALPTVYSLVAGLHTV